MALVCGCAALLHIARPKALRAFNEPWPRGIKKASNSPKLDALALIIELKP